MAIFEIPLNPGSQTATISLAGKSFTLNVIWRGDVYLLDLISQDGSASIYGVALALGALDLAGPLRLFVPNFPRLFVDGAADSITYDNLGTLIRLYADA